MVKKNANMTAKTRSTVRATIVDTVMPIQTVIPQHQATLSAIVTIDQIKALPERNKTHKSREKINTINVPNTAIWLSTPCICPIMEGVPTG